MTNRAVSKVILNGVTLIDLTQDSVTAATLSLGETATGADGVQITGTYSPKALALEDEPFDDYGIITTCYGVPVDFESSPATYDVIISGHGVEDSNGSEVTSASSGEALSFILRFSVTTSLSGGSWYAEVTNASIGFDDYGISDNYDAIYPVSFGINLAVGIDGNVNQGKPSWVGFSSGRELTAVGYSSAFDLYEETWLVFNNTVCDSLYLTTIG